MCFTQSRNTVRYKSSRDSNTGPSVGYPEGAIKVAFKRDPIPMIVLTVRSSTQGIYHLCTRIGMCMATGGGGVRIDKSTGTISDELPILVDAFVYVYEVSRRATL